MVCTLSYRWFVHIATGGLSGEGGRRGALVHLATGGLSREEGGGAFVLLATGGLHT